MSTQTQPIDLYYAPTPNGAKPLIYLEELGVPYTLHRIDIGAGDQFKPDFLKISPNNKIPAIVDPEGPGDKPLALFESGAILLYLARKFGQFYAKDTRGQAEIEQWLMWQVGGFGPMLGQAHFFNVFSDEKVPLGIKRYSDEANRLYGVLNKHLADRDYVAPDYSIADMAIFPWSLKPEMKNVDMDDYPNITAWQERLMARAAIKRAFEIAAG